MDAEIVPQDYVLPVRLIAEQLRKHSRAGTKFRPGQLVGDQASHTCNYKIIQINTEQFNCIILLAE